jgi:hypothetical protein
MPTVIISNSAVPRQFANTKSTIAQMIQTFFGQRSIFTFEWAPVEVRFEALAATYEQIERPGKYPLLSYRGLPLAKAVIEFRHADRRSGGVANIERALNQLRDMATLPAPVVFNGGMDNMLFRPVGSRGTRLINWRITDMSINVVQRNTLGQSTHADISITLTEERNPTLPTVFLPVITYSDFPPRRVPAAPSGGSGGGGGGGGGRPVSCVTNYDPSKC